MVKWFAVTAVIAFVGFVAADTKADLEAFQGKWVLKSSEKDGKTLPTGSVRVVTGSNYVIEKDGKAVAKGTLKLDASTTPRAIDVTREGGKAMLGIYSLDGDEQKICYAPEGKARPTEFTSKDGNTLSVWKKGK